MIEWLFDTFIYTGLLIGAVLILRRPATRFFGPQIAYSLWALPLLRFIMPPIVLPASMAPEPELAGTVVSEPLLVIADQVPAEPAVAPVVAMSSGSPVETIASASAYDWTELALPIWIVGAVLFLAWRTHSYFEMRKHLLADARPVGEAGKVRLVESPSVMSPVAFGVRDKVVALPLLFMAHPDREARDLAIAHELAHHRGHDLLANIVAQPMLALHWFNPIAWLGWRAMRRDQEAACDARVMDGRNRDERAAYAHVIASFAQGERLALAAPMACPILGEKSIIHRLRSLSMSDISSSRRKLGRSLLVAGAFALPMTASISYSAAEAQESDVQSVDVPPSAYADGTEELPPASEATTTRVIKFVGESEDGEPAAYEFEWHSDEDHDFDFDFDPDVDVEEIHREVREAHRELERAQRDIERAQREVEREVRRDVEREVRLARKQRLSEQEVIRIERRANAEAKRALAEAGRMEKVYKVALTNAAASIPEVIEACDADPKPVTTTVLPDGRTRIMICERGMKVQAINGLRSARATIATTPDIGEAERTEILQELDEEILELENEA